jgi:hypothetical protein
VLISTILVSIKEIYDIVLTITKFYMQVPVGDE